MIAPVTCVLLFAFGLVGARSLRQRGLAVPKWPLVAASSLATLTFLLVRRW
ncbi:hypothetical protein ACRAWG_39365 (plasmid) [Methylobacterium sp. P31]